jgi:hypothetical protein
MQKSGPNSPLSRFLRLDPFPLRLENCVGEPELAGFVTPILSANGLRFGPTIGRRLEANLRWLNDGGWSHVEDQFSVLSRIPRNAPDADPIRKERHAVRLVVMMMEGFGPKQARNLWQCMGVTRYEIPLDSRITKWLWALPNGLDIVPEGLQRPAYYEKIESHIQRLCELAGAFPCEFDAAVFVSADEDEWPEDDVVW